MYGSFNLLVVVQVHMMLFAIVGQENSPLLGSLNKSQEMSCHLPTGPKSFIKILLTQILNRLNYKFKIMEAVKQEL